jgi:hypothetical protein
MEGGYLTEKEKEALQNELAITKVQRESQNEKKARTHRFNNRFNAGKERNVSFEDRSSY